MPADRPVLIAANPYSGAGRNRRRVDALTRALAASGLEARVVWDADECSAVLADAPLMRRWCAVVVAGGDGTVADIVNHLAGPAPLAVLPLGSENLFARANGFGADPAALARAIKHGRTRQLDLGLARAGAPPANTARRFTLMLSVGFDADVVHRVAQWRGAGRRLRRVRRRSWVMPLVCTLLTYPNASLNITTDGAMVRGVHCIIANLPDYALGLRPAPMARADDGLLDWVVLQRSGSVALARYCWAARCRKAAPRVDVRQGRARRITIDAAPAVPVQIDGDGWGFTPVSVEVLPAALNVISVDAPS